MSCSNALPSLLLDELDLAQMCIIYEDLHRRFIPAEDGLAKDEFGRNGVYRERGVQLYRHNKENKVYKVFGADFCEDGEGHFLEKSLKAGLYDGLCPILCGLIHDTSGRLRGYVTHVGEVLTKAEFKKLVHHQSRLAEGIKSNTRKSGYYLYDLTAFNTVRWKNQLSLIDLESALPLDWFGQNTAFAESHTDVVDVGYPLQNKWHSPWWYFKHLKKLTGNTKLTRTPFIYRAARAKVKHRLKKLVPVSGF